MDLRHKLGRLRNAWDGKGEPREDSYVEMFSYLLRRRYEVVVDEIRREEQTNLLLSPIERAERYRGIAEVLDIKARRGSSDINGDQKNNTFKAELYREYAILLEKLSLSKDGEN